MDSLDDEKTGKFAKDPKYAHDEFMKFMLGWEQEEYKNQNESSFMSSELERPSYYTANGEINVGSIWKDKVTLGHQSFNLWTFLYIEMFIKI